MNSTVVPREEMAANAITLIIYALIAIALFSVFKHVIGAVFTSLFEVILDKAGSLGRKLQKGVLLHDACCRYPFLRSLFDASDNILPMIGLLLVEAVMFLTGLDTSTYGRGIAAVLFIIIACLLVDTCRRVLKDIWDDEKTRDEVIAENVYICPPEDGNEAHERRKST